MANAVMVLTVSRRTSDAVGTGSRGRGRCAPTGSQVRLGLTGSIIQPETNAVVVLAVSTGIPVAVAASTALEVATEEGGFFFFKGSYQGGREQESNEDAGEDHDARVKTT